MSYLKLSGVSKSYGELQVVKDFNLTVEKGEFVSLLGPSGCGKTTTLHMIAGFTEVTSGSVELDGTDITRVKPHCRGLGIVFQTYALFPHMTVEKNVAFGLETRKVPRKEQQERIAEALSLVKLDAFADRYPRELSGGQRQRVALARALVIRPPILLLDEPLSNLDAKLREEMQFELRSIQQRVGTTTIMVTHDQSEALSTSDRIVVMEAGRAIQVNEPYEVYENPRTRFIAEFVGKTNIFDGRVEESENGHCLRGKNSHTAIPLPSGCAPAGYNVSVSIRPEKFSIASAGQGRLPACKVTSRYFLGSQWLYEFSTPLGSVVVVASNTGQRPLGLGAEAGLDWRDDAIRLITATA